VVSEGVKTDDQHQIITDLGSDSGQGYNFGRPRDIASEGDLTGIEP
jgi:EAL domain-containing protein (putative c-di-GMP-specific phosphodiesterase class I)